MRGRLHRLSILSGRLCGRTNKNWGLPNEAILLRVKDNITAEASVRPITWIRLQSNSILLQGLFETTLSPVACHWNFFPWISKTSESSIIRQRKQVLEWLHISIRGILHFLLRTYLEYVKITTLKADINSNRRALRTKMSRLIQDIRLRAANKNSNPSNRVIQLICDFLERSSSSGNKPEESLFNWKGVKNFSAQITYRTYQRTVFKRYRKNTYGLYASID